MPTTSIDSASRQPLDADDHVREYSPATCSYCGDGAGVDAGPRGFQVICACGCSGPWTSTDDDAIEAWDDLQFALKDLKS